MEPAWLPNLAGGVSIWSLARDLNRADRFDGRLLVPIVDGPDNLPVRVEWNVTGLVPVEEARAADPDGVARALDDFAKCVERAVLLFDEPGFAKYRAAFTLPALSSEHWFYGGGKLSV